MTFLKNISLRIRIFIAMILLVLLASILIVVVTIYQYKEQTKEYNVKRFGRKEAATKQNIEIELKNNQLIIKGENLYLAKENMNKKECKVVFE